MQLRFCKNRMPIETMVDGGGGRPNLPFWKGVKRRVRVHCPLNDWVETWQVKPNTHMPRGGRGRVWVFMGHRRVHLSQPDNRGPELSDPPMGVCAPKTSNIDDTPFNWLVNWSFRAAHSRSAPSASHGTTGWNLQFDTFGYERVCTDSRSSDWKNL